MAKLQPSGSETTSPVNSGAAPPISPPTQSLDWWNATKNIPAAYPTVGAIICPPSSMVFYEFGDVNGEICLAPYNTPISPGAPLPTPQQPNPLPTPVPVPIPAPTPQTQLVPGIVYFPSPKPVNAHPIQTAAEAFTIKPDISQKFVYNVGNPYTNAPILAGIRNNLATQALKITINPPAYLSIDVSGSVAVPPNNILLFNVTLNEAYIKAEGENVILEDDLDLEINVDILYDGNTIYVSENLPDFDPNTTIPISSSIDFSWFNVTKRIFTSQPTGTITVCPPGSKRYYEFGDPTADACLIKYQLNEIPLPTPVVLNTVI